MWRWKSPSFCYKILEKEAKKLVVNLHIEIAPILSLSTGALLLFKRMY